MGFIKKKEAQPKEEQPKEELDEKTKQLVNDFNSMIENYAVLTPDHFRDETKALQHNLLYAIYCEIKKLRETIEGLESGNK